MDEFFSYPSAMARKGYHNKPPSAGEINYYLLHIKEDSNDPDGNLFGDKTHRSDKEVDVSNNTGSSHSVSPRISSTPLSSHLTLISYGVQSVRTL